MCSSMSLHDLNLARKIHTENVLISENGGAKRHNICGLRLGTHEKSLLGKHNPSEVLLQPRVAGAEVAAEEVLSCHPERSEGSAFLRQIQEKADSSANPALRNDSLRVFPQLQKPAPPVGLRTTRWLSPLN
jgi:hypothetical protein